MLSDVLLLDAIIRVVAQKGVEGTSTRAVAAEEEHGLTDTVIYRFFSGKEDLMQKAFVSEITAFMKQVESLFPVLWEKNISREQRLCFLWHTIWALLSQHKAVCAFMIRYYYSASFDENAKTAIRQSGNRLRTVCMNFYRTLNRRAIWHLKQQPLLFIPSVRDGDRTAPERPNTASEG